MTILILSAATENLRWQYGFTNYLKRHYANLHNYTFEFVKLDDIKDSYFQRIDLIKDRLQLYDWIMWMDTDTWFNDFDKKLEDIINSVDANISLIIAKDHVGGDKMDHLHEWYVNSGVFLIRGKSNRSEYILDSWKNFSEIGKKWLSDKTKLNDQPRLCCKVMFDYGVYSATKIVSYIDLNYFIYKDGYEDKFILHASGFTKRNKLNKYYSALENSFHRAGIKFEYKKSELKLICSMTSYPARINGCYNTVKSIINNSLAPDKVVLYLVKSDFKNKELPDNLVQLDKRSKYFKIRWVDENWNSAGKIVHALRDFPNDLIMCIDDDMIYDRDFVWYLADRLGRDIGHVICNFAHTIERHENTFKLVKNTGGHALSKKVSSCYNRPLSGHGVIYQPNIFFGSEIFNFKLYKELADKHDDHWVWINLFKNRVKVCRTEAYEFGKHYVGDMKNQDVGLYHFNDKRREKDLLNKCFKFMKNHKWI